MKFWTRNFVSPTLKELKLAHTSRSRSEVSQWLFDSRMKPCMDIVHSDSFVRGLSSDDKELLALYTKASSLFMDDVGIVEGGTSDGEDEDKDEDGYSDSEDVDHDDDDEYDDDDGSKEFIENARWRRQRLLELFKMAPPIINPLLLFRGVQVKCDDIVLLSRNPISSSFDPNVATGFADSYRHCVMTVEIPVGSRILALDSISTFGGAEREILLCPFSRLSRASRGVTSQDIDHFTLSFQEEDIRMPPAITKPVYVDKQMSRARCIDILRKVRFNLSAVTLFGAIRTWQLIHCGFGGDSTVAVTSFWKQLSSLSKQAKSSGTLNLRTSSSEIDSRTIDKVLSFKSGFDNMYSTFRKTLESANDLLEQMHEFAVPFMSAELQQQQHRRRMKRKVVSASAASSIQEVEADEIGDDESSYTPKRHKMEQDLSEILHNNKILVFSRRTDFPNGYQASDAGMLQRVVVQADVFENRFKNGEFGETHNW